MRKNEFKRWQGMYVALALVLLVSTGCNKEPNEAEALLRSMGAFLENPRPSDTATLFGEYITLATGNANAVPSIRSVYLKDAYTKTMQAKGFENVPAPVWAALLKSYFAAASDSPWNPKNLREASTTVVEPWGWIARSKGSSPLWLTLCRPAVIEGGALRLVAISASEQEARKAGADYTAWQLRLKEQVEKEVKEAEERKAREVEEEKLRKVKLQCFYNMREKALQQLEMTDVSVTMVEEYSSYFARIRFKVRNASSAIMRKVNFAVIIRNAENRPVIISSFSSRDEYPGGEAYWRTVDLRNLEEVLAAKQVLQGGYSISVESLDFEGGANTVPTEQYALDKLKLKDGKWACWLEEVSPEVNPRILEKFQNPPEAWQAEKEKQASQLREIRKQAQEEAATLLAGVSASLRVAPNLENGRMSIDIIVTNSTARTVDGMDLLLSTSEQEAIVDERNASSSDKIASGTSKTLRFSVSDAELIRLHPQIIAGGAAMKVRLQKVRMDGKYIDATGGELLPRLFRP